MRGRRSATVFDSGGVSTSDIVLKSIQKSFGGASKIKYQLNDTSHLMGLFDLNSTQKTMIAGIAFTNIQVLALIAIAGGAAAYHWHLGPFKQGGGTGY